MGIRVSGHEEQPQDTYTGDPESWPPGLYQSLLNFEFILVGRVPNNEPGSRAALLLGGGSTPPYRMWRHVNGRWIRLGKGHRITIEVMA